MNLDVKQLCLDILRDLYGSSRRLALYPLGHPITQETLKKPLSELNEIFQFKHSFTIEMFKDKLLAEGILLDDNVFVSGLALDLKKHKINDVSFNSQITIGDLYHFLMILVSRPSPFDDNVSRLLLSRKISAIKVNAANKFRLFDFDYSGAVSSDDHYELRDRTRYHLARKPEIIAAYYMGQIHTDEEVAALLDIDFRLPFLVPFFREILARLESRQALSLLESVLLATNWLDDSAGSQAVAGLKRLFNDYIAGKSDEAILSAVYQMFKKVGAPEPIINQVIDTPSFLKLKTFQETETVVNSLRFSDPSQVDPDSLKKIIFKLAISKQKSCLRDLLDQLISTLSSSGGQQGIQAAELVAAASEVLANGGFYDDFNYVCREVMGLSILPDDSAHNIELTGKLIWQALKNNRWQEFKVLARTLRGRAEDPLAPPTKKELSSTILAGIASSEIFSRVVANLLEHNWSEEASDFFEGLTAIGSRDTVKLLVSKIAHTDINIRSRVIKILVAMKHDSAPILTETLAEMVAKNNGGAISEDEWYCFRNILRVLKEVKAVKAAPYLEIIAGWPITRLKLEVIKTLENIYSADTGRILERLSADSNPEVQKAAVIAMGFSGDNEMLDRLAALLRTRRHLAVTIVASIGRIGGIKARDLLINIIEDEKLHAELQLTKKDLDEIRQSVIRILSGMDDDIAREKVKAYFPKSERIPFFKRNLLSETARTIIFDKKK